MTKLTIKEKLGKIVDVIFHYRKITSCILSIVVTVLYIIGIIHSVKDVLPHIITFSTIMLTVVGLVFTIIVSIREEKVFKILGIDFATAKDELYHILKLSIVLCVAVVIESIGILILSINNDIFKYILCLGCSFTFFMMLCTTASAFLISVSLLQIGDDLKKQ